MAEFKSTTKFKPSFMDLKYDQDRAYYESLEKDMEKDFQAQLAEIAKREREEMEEIKKRKAKELENQLEKELEKELEKQLEKEIKEKKQNQPSKEEMRQRRLNFYEK